MLIVTKKYATGLDLNVKKQNNVSNVGKSIFT